jgi:hypothetical protein
MSNLRRQLQNLKQVLFGKSEIKNRISANAVKMIIGDITTLYGEFRKAEGAGALFFNPSYSDQSQYLTIPEIRKDITLAEEMMNSKLCKFLADLINVIEKEQDSDKPVVVMVDNTGMSAHVIDLEKATMMIDKQVEDALRS